MRRKISLGINVYKAAKERINWTFSTFDRVCLSLSGGKDSTVMLHLSAEIARQKKQRFSVLFIDWEVQFSYTIEHILRLKELHQDVIDQFFWIALPMTTTNGVSQIQPMWTAWEPGLDWIRQPPEGAITDFNTFPFYQNPMTFEDFVPAFSTWFSRKRNAAMLIGIRADESLNRFSSICSKRKLRYDSDKPWTTISQDGFVCNVYPIYDWKLSDVWHYFSQTKLPYNRLYDLMYRAGVPFGLMRICEPFGMEQRKGLWLYHVLEPETWSKACERVEGANAGALYANESGNYFAKHRISKPVHHTWKSYALFLLDSMPARTAEHYRNKIAIYIKWYKNHGYPEDIPDEQEKDLGVKDIPSWRRICKTIIKNDYWCRSLSFSPTKSAHYERYLSRIKEKRKEWNIL